jgi:Na+-translocating ferredoxin:NAD+ oxidoreductase RnfE subunit
MNRRSHPFWGTDSPLSSLGGLALIVLSSGRTAHALAVSLALLFVSLFFSLSVRSLRPIFPRRGRELILVLLSAFWGSLFLLLLSLFSPVLALECGFFITLVPVISLGKPEDPMPSVLMRAAVLGALILALALIREPLGFGSLSLPGGPGGLIEIFHVPPLFRIVSGSSGALMILAAILALYRKGGGE